MVPEPGMNDREQMPNQMKGTDGVSATPDRCDQSETSRGKWQYSLTSLVVLITLSAVFLSVCMSIPGLKELPIVVIAIAVPAAIFFGAGVLIGWISERK